MLLLQELRRGVVSSWVVGRRQLVMAPLKDMIRLVQGVQKKQKRTIIVSRMKCYVRLLLIGSANM